jgi:hypothetical protein
MQRLGVLEPNGARVLSYLLFEQAYCRHLMRLGSRMGRRSANASQFLLATGGCGTFEVGTAINKAS